MCGHFVHPEMFQLLDENTDKYLRMCVPERLVCVVEHNVISYKVSPPHYNQETFLYGLDLTWT